MINELNDDDDHDDDDEDVMMMMVMVMVTLVQAASDLLVHFHCVHCAA